MSSLGGRSDSHSCTVVRQMQIFQYICAAVVALNVFESLGVSNLRRFLVGSKDNVQNCHQRSIELLRLNVPHSYAAAMHCVRLSMCAS